MPTNYANILATRFHAHSDTSMQGDVELAFYVIENLSSTDIATEPWQKLLVLARGLIKTRARRSRSRFKLQYIKALEYSDLLKPKKPQQQEEVTVEPTRDEKFKDRIRNPTIFRRGSKLTMESKEDIEATKSSAIIREDTPIRKEREDEFVRRIRSPESFRRSPKSSL